MEHDGLARGGRGHGPRRRFERHGRVAELRVVSRGVSRVHRVDVRVGQRSDATAALACVPTRAVGLQAEVARCGIDESRIHGLFVAGSRAPMRPPMML